MTDDIFDYFSGNSNRKVEPIDDDDDQLESSIEPAESDVWDPDDVVEEEGVSETAVAETTSDQDSSPVAEEAEEKVSHWDRLLGKLGIAAAPKGTEPPKSIELPKLSADEKAARAVKRKEREKTRSQLNQPFGGIAAPPGSKPKVKPAKSSVMDEQPGEPVSKAATEPKKSPSKKKEKPAAAAPRKFGLGILEEASDDVPEDVAHGNKTLADMFAAAEQFEPPFEETKPEVDDFDDELIADVEPIRARIHQESEQPVESDSDDVLDVPDFIEYEVEDLDFTESSDERPRRPSRRDRARRSRSKPGSEDVAARGRGQRDQAPKETEETQTHSRGGRKSRDRDDGERGTQRDKAAVEGADSTETRSRRGSRGRGRGRGSRDSRPPRDARDRVETDEAELDESLEIVDREGFDDRDDGPDRSRGRKKPRGDSRRSRQENHGQDDIDIDRDPRDGYDDEKPEPTRARRRRRPEAEEAESDTVAKRPKIPTWSEAVGSMIETNIKARGSKSSGPGRGRGARRPRRR